MNQAAASHQQELKYNPQFDGLRFLAVLLVASYHWLPSVSKHPLASFFGGMVNFFFVLSSYLITRILFSAKTKSIEWEVPWYKFMGVFLLRRTVRIFPAYYVFLILILMIPGIGMPIKEHPGMYFAYLANFQMFQSGDFPSVAAHIWTLAVEEQFYLFWPLLIFFVPRKYLLQTILFLVAFTVSLRAFLYSPVAGVPQVILTQYSIDAFAVGALLAYKVTAPESERKRIAKYLNPVVFLCIPLAVTVIIFRNQYLSFVFNRLAFSLISMKLIEGAAYGYQNAVGRFLEKNWVTFLGRISYGIYLYHLFVPVAFWRLYKLVKHSLIGQFPGFYLNHRKQIGKFELVLVSEGVSYVIYAALTLLLALLSWKFLETPLNRFKISYKTAARNSNPEAQQASKTG